jgi:hypothetical protein
MVGAALRGEEAAAEQAGEICAALARDKEPALAAIGRALQELLSGAPPADALAGLPPDPRDRILAGLQENPEG